MKFGLKMIACFLIAMQMSFATTTNRYTIVIDAGSSGSRLHLFQSQPSRAHALPDIQDIFTENSSTSIASYADHPEGAGESLKKLFDDATTSLQNQHIDTKTVRVHLLATAGMRLLTDEQQLAIYQNIKHYLQTHYRFPLAEIKTISGKEEALYGWLDINYLAHTFQDGLPTLGSIDMGGASVEVAFATRDPRFAKDETKLIIGGKHYSVFSKSLLGFGQDQARNTMNEQELANTCYPAGYPYKPSDYGNYGLMSCKTVYQTLLAPSVNRRTMANSTPISFIAYSGVYYTYQFFNTDKTPDISSLEAQIQSVCSRTWEQLKRDYPQTPEKYLSTYCANGAYQDAFLYSALKISGNRLTVTNKVNQQDIDWALGAVLYRLESVAR